MGRTKYHMQVNIQGLMKLFRKQKMDGLIIDEDGKSLSDTEARVFLNECLSEGMKYVPNHMCKGFDPMENGCPGHPIEEFDS